MTTSSDVVLVGAGLCAALAAQTLREEGFAGRVVLVGAEPHRPYERPPLSKGYLQGGTEREEVFVHPEGWYREHDVELRTGVEVTAVDRERRQVELAGGDRLGYDQLLLATGAEPRRLDVEGADLDGVLLLRRLEDSDAIREAFARLVAAGGGRVAIVGGGWIGLETAAAARGAGLEVTVLEQDRLPLLRVLGPQMAQVFADLHRQHGVDLRCGVTVAALAGTQGRVSGVRLRDGRVLSADLVLVGVGVVPRTALAEAAGLEVRGGVVVDAHLRSSDPRILAAGDVANAYSRPLGRHLRVEHWANARRQGAVAARSILGQDVVDEQPPYFFTDQYDLGMEYTGYVGTEGYERVVVRGRIGSREFVAFWVTGGRVLAGMNVNVWDVADQIERLVLSGATVDPHRLADPSVPLEELAEDAVPGG
jgi:3-phenylpropionate/trans-cinnamate dioxygenase ferredoxin reductase component